MKYFGVAGEYLHDAGFSLIDENGNILFATQAERYTKVKHDDYIPKECWDQFYNKDDCEVICNDDWVVREKFRKGILETLRSQAPNQFTKECEMWKKHPAVYDGRSAGHHLTHCIAALVTRPESFAREDCVMVAIDGIGEYQSAVIYDHNFNLVKDVTFPKSIGYLWAWFTAEIGLRPNEDEYVTMGLASYGKPTAGEEAVERFSCIPEWDVESEWVDVEWVGKYFAKDLFLTKIVKFLLGSCATKEDAAASLQYLTNHYLYEFMKEARKYGSKLCYSGGVAQNIVANTYFADLFDDIWVDLNPGDGGASLGSAAYGYMQDTGKDRINWTSPFLGYNIDREVDPEQVVDYLLKEKVCGIANGPAEFSYRAYGNRSLIGDVRYDVKDTVNQIKRRQKYRPFAPAILEEHAEDYFEGRMNRWMQFTAKAKHDYSSVTHVDGTGRVQLVPKDCKSVFRQIIECYYDRTGVPMLLNTSLNIRGKPMVNDEQDAEEFSEKYNVKVF